MRISDWSSDVCSSDLGWIDLTIHLYEQAIPRLHRPIDKAESAIFEFFLARCGSHEIDAHFAPEGRGNGQYRFDNRPACFNDDQGFEEFTVTDDLWRAHFHHGIRRQHLPDQNRAASKQVEKTRQHDASQQNYGYG